MKNLIKNSLVIVVMVTALLGNANPTLKRVDDGRTTVLTIKDAKNGSQLFIKDSFGVTLYKEEIQNSGDYYKGFDLTELPDGAYFFELDKGLEIKVIPFTVKTKVVEFENDKETIVYKPLVRSKDNLVYVSKLSLNKQPVTIDIYYDNTEVNGFGLIYSETLGNTQTIKRVYNLDENEKGNYKIVTKTEGRTFIDYVQI